MPLRLEQRAEVLDGSQRPNGGIEKRQQVSNEHVIQKQPSVAVRVVATQLPQLPLEQTHILAADHRLRPNRQLTFLAIPPMPPIMRKSRAKRKPGPEIFPDSIGQSQRGTRLMDDLP